MRGHGLRVNSKLHKSFQTCKTTFGILNFLFEKFLVWLDVWQCNFYYLLEKNMRKNVEWLNWNMQARGETRPPLSTSLRVINWNKPHKSFALSACVSNEIPSSTWACSILIHHYTYISTPFLIVPICGCSQDKLTKESRYRNTCATQQINLS